MIRQTVFLVVVLLFFSIPVVAPFGVARGGAPQGVPGGAGIDGEAVYRSHCLVCHSLAPPPKAAPPIKGLAKHYREAFASREAGVAYMKAFMKKPDASKAICHKEAIERFGLMPAMTLPDDELQAVAAWIWDQFDPAMTGGH